VTRAEAGLTVVFDFDPYLRLGEFAVRWETLGVAVAIFFGIVLAALVAGRTPGRDLLIGEAEPRREDGGGPWHLRREDLLFMALGAVPGAVVLGRLGYGLLHADFYATEWWSLVDPTHGSLELALGVVGGLATAIYVAAVVGAPVARWLHVAIVPLLAALALGKAAQALGGSGQGAASDGLATAYLPPGPWGSPGAEIPAHPSQLYEAATTLAVLFAVILLARFTPLRRADGRLFAVGICLWALGRAAVASTWRDPTVIAGLNAGQLIALAVAAAAIGTAVVASQGREGSAGEPGPRGV
jgi:phosphatidylglycerol:prolipoprotein diacylglycerol transferase